MGKGRPETLQAFLEAVERVLLRDSREYKGRDVAASIFASVRRRAGSVVLSPQSHRIVDENLHFVLQRAAQHSTNIGAVATAFGELAPELNWHAEKIDHPSVSANFPTGHAIAVIVGKNGLERRDDITIGVSVFAPNVRAHDHSHPPEELYLALSEGEFRHGEYDWVATGIGGTFHNVPDLDHAMRSVDTPLLAFWFLHRNQEVIVEGL